MKVLLATLILLALSLLSITVEAQNRSAATQSCPGPVFSAKDVSRRAKVLEIPNLGVLQTAAGPLVRVHAVVDAVLCRSGRVTDIRVVEIAPPEIRQFAVAVVSFVRFAPAEKNWHTVSVRQRFEFAINGGQPAEAIDPEDRLIEEIDIIGNRRMTAQQILSWIKSRPGERYNGDQIKRDMHYLLETGIFDPTMTRVRTEEGVRDGITVLFDVVELPLLGEIKFTGLKIDPALVLRAWEQAPTNLRIGVPVSPEALRTASETLKQILESKGVRVLKIEVLRENVTATTVNVTFVINE